MIVKIKLKSKDNDEFTMMFGNSYKSWESQFREYCQNFKPVEILQLETSKEDWIGWGGLKWCSEDEFQDELNREGCQEGELDNSDPRIYAEMHFVFNKIAENIANKIHQTNSKFRNT